MSGAPYFTIKRDTDGQYRGRYWSGGNLVWWTEGYTSKPDATNAIESIKRGASTAPVLDRT